MLGKPSILGNPQIYLSGMVRSFKRNPPNGHVIQTPYTTNHMYTTMLNLPNHPMKNQAPPPLAPKKNNKKSLGQIHPIKPKGPLLKPPPSLHPRRWHQLPRPALRMPHPSVRWSHGVVPRLRKQSLRG